MRVKCTKALNEIEAIMTFDGLYAYTQDVLVILIQSENAIPQ